MKKSSTSQALVPTDMNALNTATSQLRTLSRVLEGHSHWLKEKALALVKRPEAEAALTAVREMRDTAEKGRKMLTKPLVDEKARVDAAYKPFKEQCEALDRHVARLVQGSIEEERRAARAVAEKEAKRAEEKGAVQLAEDIRELAVEARPVMASMSLQRVQRAKVVDLVALCRAIGEGKASPTLVEPVLSTLQALARVGGEPPPGVEFVVEEVLRR